VNRMLIQCLTLAVLGTACGGEIPAPATAAPDTGVAAAIPMGWAFGPSGVAPAYGTGGMVSTTDSVATEVGVGILRRGGNAVDAAIATHFALAVVNPEAGNIGGGGFLVVRMADGATATLDFREKAPLAATRDMFLDARGEPTDRSVVGHLAAGVPGSVAGMWEAHRRYGSLPWAELLAPAVALAEGMTVQTRLANSLQAYEARLRLYPATAAALLPQGRAPRVGEWLEQPDLAATLRAVARDGRDGFYRGRTAELIVEEMRRGGGIITLEDLAAYEGVWRDPVTFRYRDHTVIAMAPPSSGGATLAQILNILEGYDLRGLGFHSREHVHLWAEAAKRAFADRNAYLADSDFVPQPIDRMISEEHAARQRAGIPLDRATPSSEVLPSLGPVPGLSLGRRESANTTHFSVLDAAGNAAALTTTINGLYGNRVMVAGAGFILNNTMDDFTVKPGTPNLFGLVQGEANAIEPGKRMLSAMTPTIVLGPDERVRLITGAPGGPTIISTVAQLVSNVVDFGMDVGLAASVPRLHHQHLPDLLEFERSGLRPEVVEGLRAMGHQVRERTGFISETHSIMVLPDGGLAAAADPRRAGLAAAAR
jgi:gamma-glutamyltranspeptidase / glutathione hydrolase